MKPYYEDEAITIYNADCRAAHGTGGAAMKTHRDVYGCATCGGRNTVEWVKYVYEEQGYPHYIAVYRQYCHCPSSVVLHVPDEGRWKDLKDG